MNEPIWQTQEVVRRLKEDADMEEVRELIEEAGVMEAPDALEKWVRQGNAPKSFYDALYRFSIKPDGVYAFVDWDDVIQGLLHEEDA